jgi:hypothetical protein
MTDTNLGDVTTAYSEVDNANREFLQNWLNIADRYLGERQEITGAQFSTYEQGTATDFDIDRAFITAAALNIFFPRGHATLPDNYYLIPQINDYTSSVATTYTNTREQDHVNAHLFLIDSMINGWGGGGGVLNTTTNAIYHAGDLQVTVASTANFVAGNCVMLIEAAPPNNERVLYIRNVVNLTTADVFDIGGSGDIAMGANVRIRDAGVTWTDAQRNNFPALSDSTFAIDAYCRGGAWLACLAAELVALGTIPPNINDDTRVPQAAQNAAARVVIPVIEAAINAWVALGVAGPGCMYNDAGLTAFRPSVVVRVAQVIARIAQLITALGSVTDNGDGTYTVATGAAAFKYEWADRRVNKSYGSLSQQNNTNETRNIIVQQLASSTDAYDNYSDVMLASAFKEEPDGTRSITVKDTTGFLAGDAIYVTDEENVELPGNILGVFPSTLRIDLDIEIPVTYTTDNLVRLYKVL